MGARCALISALFLLIASPAIAQDSVDIEFVEGPVLGSNRIVGMGGAFVSVAEGADAHMFNPASFAMRYPWARDDWFDWDWSLYWLNDTPGDATNPDLAREADNLGGTFLLGAGIDLRMSGFGTGLHVRTRSADFIVRSETPDADGRTSHRYQLIQTIGTLGLAALFREPQIAIGLGITTSTISLNDTSKNEDFLRLNGGGITAGAVWAPEGTNYRVGLDYRSPILVAEEEIAAPDYLATQPINAMRVPGRLAVGASYMFWERTYNPTFTLGSKHAKPVADRIAPGSRRYVLLAADLVAFGRSENAISASSYLDGSNVSSGADVTFQPKLGLESEFWANEMRARTGTYYEPSRVEDLTGRVHWTAGVDYRIHFLTDWRLNAVLDIASNYLNWGIGIGFWN